MPSPSRCQQQTRHCPVTALWTYLKRFMEFLKPEVCSLCALAGSSPSLGLGGALGPNDLTALAEAFPVLHVTRVPAFTPKDREAVRRWVVALDCLYEAGTWLVCEVGQCRGFHAPVAHRCDGLCNISRQAARHRATACRTPPHAIPCHDRTRGKRRGGEGMAHLVISCYVTHF